MSEIATEVARQAALGVEMLQDRAESKLDFSESSLPMIEEILSEAAAFYSELPESQIEAIVQRLGCYILSVAHRQFGGAFYWHDERNQPVLVVGEPEKHVAILTWDKVKGRLSGDTGDNIPFFYQGFSERAAHAPAGTHVLYV